MKIREVIEAIIASHQPLQRAETCDVVKYGDPERECTGVAVTCFPSADVIRRTARAGANLLICHEPLFYHHDDHTDWLRDNRVYQAKVRLLDETGVVVWRDHDYIHSGGAGKDHPRADGIFFGFMQEMGWQEYLLDSPDKPLLYSLPERSAEELGRELIRKLGLNGMRIVGDRNARVSKVRIAEHVVENDRSKAQVAQAEADDVDALIPLELIDWTLSAYIRDASQLVRPRVIYNIGHFNVEELGMKHMVKWLPELLGDGVPVHYVQSGDSFDFIV